jgi:citrate lyase beta subunit
VKSRRSLLFAPANRTEVHAKALAAGADLLCLDLEDAVPPELKSQARTTGLRFLRHGAGSGPERVLRINALRTHDGLRDIEAVLSDAPADGILFLPKVQTPGEVDLAADLLARHAPGLRLAVLIETVRGLEAAAEILQASGRIEFAMFGGVDLAADLGVPVAAEPLLYARQRLVHAAALAGIDLIDVPCLAFRDTVMIEAEALAARQLGFTGKAALHPAGIAAIHAAFDPSPDEIAQARRIVDAYQASPDGLAKINGRLVERPVVRGAERILAMAARLAPQPTHPQET